MKLRATRRSTARQLAALHRDLVEARMALLRAAGVVPREGGWYNAPALIGKSQASLMREAHRLLDGARSLEAAWREAVGTVDAPGVVPNMPEAWERWLERRQPPLF